MKNFNPTETIGTCDACGEYDIPEKRLSYLDMDAVPELWVCKRCYEEWINEQK